MLARYKDARQAHLRRVVPLVPDDISSLRDALVWRNKTQAGPDPQRGERIVIQYPTHQPMTAIADAADTAYVSQQSGPSGAPGEGEDFLY